MDIIINEIVNTDKALRKEVEKAKLRRENLTAELADKKVIIDNEYKHNAQNQIEKARNDAQAEVKKESDSISTEIESKKQQLEKIYNENHEQWEKKIYDAVINQ